MRYRKSNKNIRKKVAEYKETVFQEEFANFTQKEFNSACYLERKLQMTDSICGVWFILALMLASPLAMKFIFHLKGIVTSRLIILTIVDAIFWTFLFMKIAKTRKLTKMIEQCDK